MACAKVFTSRNSYAVRIPKKFHIDFSELFIKKNCFINNFNTKRKQSGKS